MPYLHLPFQAGSDRILAAMNRKHTRARLSRPRRTHPRGAAGHCAFDRHHRRLPRRDGGGLRGDARRRAPRSDSRRPTRSSTARGPARRRPSMAIRFPRRVKAERLAGCRACSNASSAAFNAEAASGALLPVLFERPGRRAGQLIGRSPYLQSVHAEAAPELLGHIMPVEISASGPNSLSGVIRTVTAGNLPLARRWTFGCRSVVLGCSSRERRFEAMTTLERPIDSISRKSGRPEAAKLPQASGRNKRVRRSFRGQPPSHRSCSANTTAHLALIEDRLGIGAHAHGNVITLTGSGSGLRHRAQRAGAAL